MMNRKRFIYKCRFYEGGYGTVQVGSDRQGVGDV